jgi:hypothetical protein
MMKKSLLVPLLITGLAGFAGCSKKEETLTGCVEEHKMENLSEVDAITECLSDELKKKFTTTAECESFVEQNGGFAASRGSACMKYFEEVSQPAGDGGGGGG